jgi:uncharacterized protein
MYLNHLNHLAQHIENKYQNSEPPVNWYHPYRSAHLEDRRNELLNDLSSSLHRDFKNTKPWINSLSKGCRLCGEGEWSCLFVTGKCNANCFYCPALQDKDETPQTQKLLFNDPVTYAEYINRFQFKGVSFSGGEPLLVFDRTEKFIQTVRKQCNPELYIWMYTNGILISDDKLKALADAGLDEIRFDLGAVNYNPNILKNALRYIPNVTVEIPAVPEEKETLLKVLPQLCEFGVSNLNLHQLRLTEYNATKLLKRDYTFLHGEQPAVAESEITALEVMNHVVKNNLPIGVNYCNFQFKNRFQKAGFRNRMAQVLQKDGEEITANGYLRKIELIKEDTVNPILLNELRQADASGYKVRISYNGRVLENMNPGTDCEQFIMNNENFPVLQGLATTPILLFSDDIPSYLEMIDSDGEIIPDDPSLFEAWRFEIIEDGLRDFF